MLKQRELLQAKRTSGEIKPLKVREIAETANMKQMYNTAYAFLSLPVHSSPQNMARHFLTDEAGKITHLIWGPVHEESEGMLRHGMVLLCTCVGALGDLFQLDISAKLDSFFRRIDELVAQSTTQK